MKLYNRLIIVSFFLLFSVVASPAQSSRVINMFKSIDKYIQKKERNKEELLFTHCDVMAKGQNLKYGIVKFKKKHKYNFYIKTASAFKEIEFILLDSTRTTIKQTKIKGGKERTFSIAGYDGIAFMGMNGISFQDDEFLGVYGLVITYPKTKENTVEDIRVVDDQIILPDDVEMQTDCSFTAIKNLKFKTTTRWTKKKGKEKAKRRNQKSSVVVNSSVSKVTHKIKRRKEAYQVINKGCVPDGSFKLIVENELGHRFIMTIDKNRNHFEILPEGGSQSSVYDMTKIKN